jgi:hypothetical protein
MVLGVMLLGGVALAVTQNCTNNPCTGTNQADTLTGNNQANEIYGLGAADNILGKGGTDEAYGGPGNDEVRGGPNDDELSGDTGRDDVWGNRDNDTIFDADGFVDNVNCGVGTDDTAYVDADDDVAGCENVWAAAQAPQ